MRWLIPVRLAALALVGVSLAFGIGSLRLGLWSDGIPGPGLTTFIGSLLLLPISVALLWSHLSGEDEEPLRWSGLLGAVVFGCYVAAWQFIGFMVATFLLLGIWVKGLHRQSWVAAVATATALTLGIGVLFVYLLSVPLTLWPG